jgi:hypothetical protein
VVFLSLSFSLPTLSLSPFSSTSLFFARTRTVSAIVQRRRSLFANFCLPVPYVYVSSKMHLGRACGVSRAVIAASITSNDASELAGQIRAMRDKVERLAI